MLVDVSESKDKVVPQGLAGDFNAQSGAVSGSLRGRSPWMVANRSGEIRWSKPPERFEPGTQTAFDITLNMMCEQEDDSIGNSQSSLPKRNSVYQIGIEVSVPPPNGKGSHEFSKFMANCQSDRRVTQSYKVPFVAPPPTGFFRSVEARKAGERSVIRVSGNLFSSPFEYTYTYQWVSPVSTVITDLPECEAIIHLPMDLKPGDQISPWSTVTSADGKPVQGLINEFYRINGRPAPVIWDGKAAKIELQLSCQGHAQIFTADLHAYDPGGETILVLPGFTGIGVIQGPESALQAMVGVLAPGLIAVIGGLIGGLFSQPPSPATGGSMSDDDNAAPEIPDSPPPGPPEITLTDALGHDHSYVWNPEIGGYVNPDTKGMLDPAQWVEYNRHLPANQAFNAEQRERMQQVTPLKTLEIPRLPEQDVWSALNLAGKMIAHLPKDTADPLQMKLSEIQGKVAAQGLSAVDVADVRQITHDAWDRYQARYLDVAKQQMDVDRQYGYAEKVAQVAVFTGKIAGSYVETTLGGSGFVTGFVYGLAENSDKSAGTMIGNGVIGGAAGWAGGRLGNVSPNGMAWNATTGGLSGAGESAVSDWYNQGQVDTDKMALNAGINAAGSALGAGLQRWLTNVAPDAIAIERPPLVTDVIPPTQAIPLSQQPSAVRRMFSHVEFGPDVKPYAKLEDVLALQRSSTDMRALKQAPPEVREAFNNTLRKEVYDPHDQGLLDWISRNVPEAQGRAVRIDDFRTPGAGDIDPRAINTDRDYRVLVKDDTRGWIELPKERWQGKSYELFGQCTGIDGLAIRSAHPEIAWDRLSPAQQISKQQELWAETHQQLATDRASIEASPDYSDQHVVKGRWTEVDKNILNVKHGNGRLEDPNAIGQMYYEKVAASLRRDNLPEAVAQTKKAVDSLWGVRRGYASQAVPVGHLPDNLNQAMHIIRNAPVDHRATPEVMESMQQQLRQLGFRQGVDDVGKAISAQFGSLPGETLKQRTIRLEGS